MVNFICTLCKERVKKENSHPDTLLFSAWTMCVIQNAIENKCWNFTFFL